MAKIPRKHQKIFCSDVPASGNVGQFGSLKAGTPTYSNDPDVIQGLSAFGQGWAQAIIQQKSPPMQDFNGLASLITQQLAYLLQAGIAEWLATTPYYIGSVCQVAGAFYVSKTDNNTGNVVTNTTHWKPMIDALAGPPTARAWVLFDGTGAVVNSFNVSSVTRTNIGSFTVVFTNAMPNANYVMAGSTGTSVAGGAGGTNGGSNCGVHWSGTKTTTEIALGIWDKNGNTLRDPDFCDVIFFG